MVSELLIEGRHASDSAADHPQPKVAQAMAGAVMPPAIVAADREHNLQGGLRRADPDVIVNQRLTCRC